MLGEGLGGGIVTFSISLFVLSTIIVIVFYGEKQAEYLFGTRFAKIMKFIYLVAIFLGAYGGIEFLYSFLDILLASIVIPNMIGLVLMRNQVKELKDEFFNSSEFYSSIKAK